MPFSKLTLSFLLLNSATFLAAQSYPLVGNTSGNIIDYWPTHLNVQGDTQYCVVSAATYANGSSAGTTTYIDPSGGSHTLPKVLCTANDAVVLGSGGNILMYSLDTLDMTNAANIRTTLVNALPSYGTSPGDSNAPAGWFSKGASGDNGGFTYNWKSDQPISVSGWIIMPVFRQNQGNPYQVNDLTFVASPDGAKHWCNPNTYFNRSGGPGCDASNWQANGDAPKCGAPDGTHACTDAAYLAGTHSSVEWPGLAPYDGSNGLMQAVKFFQYCGGFDLASCSGMPNGADSVVYAYGHNGLRTNGYLAKVTKSVSALLDPSQFQFYSQSNYSPTNPGNGTSWTAAGVQSGAIPLWASVFGTGPKYLNVIQLNTTWGSPNYLCANSACSYLFYNSGGNGLITAPSPWGRFTSVYSGANIVGAFAHLLPWTASTVDSAPYHVKLIATWSDYAHAGTGANGGSQYWQPFDVTMATGPRGASLMGNSKVAFTMGSTSHSLPRAGLQYYFDFWDTGGAPVYTGGGATTAFSALDISQNPTTAALVPCISDGPYGGCGFYNPQYNSNFIGAGLFYGGPYNVGLQLRDFTNLGGNQISPQMFAGDASWTMSGVVELTSNAGYQTLFSVGGLTALTGPSTGQFGCNWGTGGGTSRWVSTSDAPLVSGVFANITITRGPGAVGTSGSSLSTHLYVNGVEHPNAMSGNGSNSTVNVSAGPLVVSYAGGLPMGSGTWAGIGFWSRALSATEVTHMYTVQKMLMARRGVTLP